MTKISQKPDNLREAGPESVAARITDELRRHLLSLPQGEFLGSEEDMLARYGVSRPTFRQTARILEQEQLLSVRRGVGGGYYVRKPDVETVGRAAASYLQSRNTTIEHLFQAAEAATTMICRLAALSDDGAARTRLQETAAKLARQDIANQDVNEFQQQDFAFRASLARLAGNPALELFLDTLTLVAYEESRPNIFVIREAREQWHALRMRLSEAILNREPDVAVALADRLYACALQWREVNAVSAGTDRNAQTQLLTHPSKTRKGSTSA